MENCLESFNGEYGKLSERFSGRYYLTHVQSFLIETNHSVVTIAAFIMRRIINLGE